MTTPEEQQDAEQQGQSLEDLARRVIVLGDAIRDHLASLEGDQPEGGTA